jgi:hypothetical protein
VGFFSCDKGTVTNQAIADAFIKSLIYQGDTLYGVAHSVVSYNGIKQASVRTPEGDTLLLPSKTDNGISFYKEPAFQNGDLTVVPPNSGTYSYRVTFRDNTQSTFTNTLGGNYLRPVRIDSLNRLNQSVVLRWDPVPDAQGYQIRIVKGNSEVIAAKVYFELDPLRLEYPISSFSPYLPGTFTVEVDALLFESSAHQQLQAISVSTASVDLQ